MSIYGCGLSFWLIVCSKIGNTIPVLVSWLRENGSAKKFHQLFIPEPWTLQKFQRQLSRARVKCSFRRESAGYWKKKICLVNAPQNRVLFLISQIMASHFLCLFAFKLASIRDSGQSFDDTKMVLTWCMTRGPKDSNILAWSPIPSPKQFLRW